MQNTHIQAFLSNPTRFNAISKLSSWYITTGAMLELVSLSAYISRTLIVDDLDPELKVWPFTTLLDGVQVIQDLRTRLHSDEYKEESAFITLMGKTFDASHVIKTVKGELAEREAMKQYNESMYGQHMPCDPNIDYHIESLKVILKDSEKAVEDGTRELNEMLGRHVKALTLDDIVHTHLSTLLTLLRQSGPTILVDTLSRSNSPINRIWVKALIRYINLQMYKGREKYTEEDMRMLSGLCSLLRSVNSSGKRHIRYLSTISGINARTEGKGSWTNPSEVLKDILEETHIDLLSSPSKQLLDKINELTEVREERNQKRYAERKARYEANQKVHRE